MKPPADDDSARLLEWMVSAGRAARFVRATEEDGAVVRLVCITLARPDPPERTASRADFRRLLHRGDIQRDGDHETPVYAVTAAAWAVRDEEAG